MTKAEIARVVGRNITYFRQRNGWSQGRFAKLVNQKTHLICASEIGKREVKVQELIRWAGVLGVKVKELLPEQDGLSTAQRNLVFDMVSLGCPRAMAENFVLKNCGRDPAPRKLLSMLSFSHSAGDRVSVCGPGGSHLYYARLECSPRKIGVYDNMVMVSVKTPSGRWGDSRPVCASHIQDAWSKEQVQSL